MKDKLVIFVTIWKCRDAQYRIDRAFSRILEQCGDRRKNEEKVREK